MTEVEDSTLVASANKAVDGPVVPHSDEPSSTTELLSELAESKDHSRRIPSLRTVSEPSHGSILPLSSAFSIREVNAAARNPRAAPAASALLMSGATESDVLARVREFHQRRMQKGPSPSSSPHLAISAVGQPGNLRIPEAHRPGPGGMLKSSPIIPSMRQKQTLSERRMGGMRLSSGTSPVVSSPKLSDIHPDAKGVGGASGGKIKSKLDEYSKYVDAEKGWLTFDGAATITNKGVNFANGHTFSISLDEIQVLAELGKGNYGTVYKVRHARPRVPRLGPGLAGATSRLVNGPIGAAVEPAHGTEDTSEDHSITGVVMAMKEIRLELDDVCFAAILKELFILHECVSPFVIDFYGAFFQEGAVYLCMEYMDGGSLDKLYQGGIPEPVLRRITYATILGLKSLKDELNIIHRDVKPTNILANTRGQIKICDFGVSGNLVASIARTNVGCQSYMAPERISGGGAVAGLVSGGPAGTYSVQSDIWSLGLTMIECAVGRYPYPPEVSSTIFSQLSAIVDGEPPILPADGFSPIAQDFIHSCLRKNPLARPTYAMLLQHPWLKPLHDADPAEALSRLSLQNGDPGVAAWVSAARNPSSTAEPASSPSKPALHKAPLDVSAIP